MYLLLHITVEKSSTNSGATSLTYLPKTARSKQSLNGRKFAQSGHLAPDTDEKDLGSKFKYSQGMIMYRFFFFLPVSKYVQGLYVAM
jgi:hypothetical protein